MAVEVEHEIQRQMLERLGIEWTPGEPFYALVEDEIEKRKQAFNDMFEDCTKANAALRAEANDQAGLLTEQAKVIKALRAENERLREAGLQLAADTSVESVTKDAEIVRLRAALEKHHLPRHASSHAECGVCGEVLSKPTVNPGRGNPYPGADTRTR